MPVSQPDMDECKGSLKRATIFGIEFLVIDGLPDDRILIVAHDGKKNAMIVNLRTTD